MTPEEIQDAVDIVFDKEFHDIKIGNKCFEVQKGGIGTQINYPNVDILIQLFANIQDDKIARDFFIIALVDATNKPGLQYPRLENDFLGSDYPIKIMSLIPLSVVTLLQLGYIQEAINIGKIKQSPLSFIEVLSKIFSIDQSYFTNKQLGELLEIIQKIKFSEDNCADGKFHNLREQKENVETIIIEDRIKNLQQQIKGINLEINQDRKEVSEIITYLDFDNRYNILLTDIDKYINTEASAATSAGMIGNLRIFFSDLVVDLANKLAENNAEVIPHEADRSQIGDARHYIKDKLPLNEEDHKLIDSFVKVLHSEGGHSFISSKKYFRLARNMAIELTLFLLSKYKEVLENK